MAKGEIEEIRLKKEQSQKEILRGKEKEKEEIINESKKWNEERGEKLTEQNDISSEILLVGSKRKFLKILEKEEQQREVQTNDQKWSFWGKVMKGKE